MKFWRVLCSSMNFCKSPHCFHITTTNLLLNYLFFYVESTPWGWVNSLHLYYNCSFQIKTNKRLLEAIEIEGVKGEYPFWTPSPHITNWHSFIYKHSFFGNFSTNYNIVKFSKKSHNDSFYMASIASQRIHEYSLLNILYCTITILTQFNGF